MTSRVARCSCGSLVVRTEGEPIRVSVCHCLDCQRRSGSAFAAQARFPEGNVRIEGATHEYVREGSDGSATFSFCPNCGGGVFYRRTAEPGRIAIPIGAFADPGFPPPTVSVFHERQHPWLTLADTIEQYE